ncbi:MAG: response regulator, partial [Bdellovibrionales bacterium]|nr:response regulator [Bdellovibrionales bacterium]
IGVGTTFYFTLEFQIANNLKESAVLQGAELQEGEHGEALHILVAEDNHINQELIRRLLQRRGHAVTIACDGNETISQFQSGSFDVILMDIQMPNLGGIEATEQIRKLERERGGHIPIIALTANAMYGDRERYLAKGMDEYISKPIKKELLDEMLDRVSKRQFLEKANS